MAKLPNVFAPKEKGKNISARGVGFRERFPPLPMSPSF
jgi:hypothetical protein